MALVLGLQGSKEEAQVAMDEAQRILPELDRTKVREFLGAWVEQTLVESGIDIRN